VVVPPLAPPALAPPEVDPPVPEAPAEPVPADAAPDEEELPLVLLDEPEPVDDAEVEVVAVVGVVEALALAGVVDPPAGTVSAGAPTVSVAAVELPPPHADSPSESDAPAASAMLAAVSRPRPNISNGSGAERLHPPAAIRAVVQILLSELVAPVAEPKVLNRPR